MNVLAGELCIDAIIVELAGGVIVWSTGRVIILLTWGMLDCDVGMISEVFVIEVIIAVIVSEVVAPVLYTTDIRAGVMTDALTGTVVSAVLANGINALAGADVNLRAAPMPVASEKALPVRRGASSCWPAAALNS